jgi:hypothetical protein
VRQNFLKMLGHLRKSVRIHEIFRIADQKIV